MNYQRLKLIIAPMRLQFLILTPAFASIGMATAYWRTGSLDVELLMMVLIGAIAAHISVNAFNEYFDFKSGLDSITVRTPFSGGTGTLPGNPDAARSALIVAWVTLGIAGLLGIYFVFRRGVELLPLGILGMLIIYGYSPIVTRNPILCLVAPGLGFGPLMVMGTDFVLSGKFSVSSFIASLIPYFLLNSLLLVNQIPDIEADRQVGRRNILIAIGKPKALIILGVYLFATYIAILAGVLTGHLPSTSLLGLGALIIAIPAYLGVYRHANNIEKLIPYMAITAVVNIITPILFSMGIFLG